MSWPCLINGTKPNLAGVFAGLLLLDPGSAVVNFSSILLEMMMDETIAWVIIVCGTRSHQ